MYLLLFYVCALALSALVLLLMAITGFGTSSVEYRILSGAGALAAGAYAFYLVFRFQEGEYLFFYGVLFLPVFVGYRVYQGFRERGQSRATRQSEKDLKKSADDWRSVRRW
ncbi:hypothetical protein [Actinoplanes derwentensis]|uniref:Uncharacterized protein n=1 Tax=Actinoplanes derwentensis TaxID=113562 RepID=A0A1H1YML6_9ACTN|nr:hypothetical protein [Actinoplanes derwentensis]GID81208.1 hypothetical protein Ade03nite_01320 [Actinoplanes derwentensis]SDT22651.1 hypothetical protein SAMN04489716_2917 [Actinoplanes derwentensis]